MVGDKRAGMVVFLSRWSKARGWQGLTLVLRSEGMFQGSREGQRWTWSKLELSMGTMLVAAHKVYVEMAERKNLSNFGNSFGGSHSYIHRDGMVVVVVNLVLFCKFSKSGKIFS